MRKNQIYSQEEMFLAVELYQESNLSQKDYAIQEGLKVGTFKYWVNKYNAHHHPKPKKNNPIKKKNDFIPIQVDNEETSGIMSGLEITYPNGVKITCPSNMEMHQIKALLSL